MDGLLNSIDSSNLAHQAYVRILQDRLSNAFEQCKPRIFPDGNQWCCLYGESIQEGVSGFGETPVKAVSDWENNFYNQKLKP